MAKKIPSSSVKNRNASPQFSAAGFFYTPSGLFLLCVLLYAAVVWTFWPALTGQFMFYDEFGYLLTNAHVCSGLTWSNVIWALFSTDFANWYPLTWISHMVDFQLHGTAPWNPPGPNPWGHHLTNVLIHAGCAVLLLLVLKRMTGALWRSLLVAGIFALHPLRVQSVAWISERKDVLSTLFWLLALWTYARFVEETRSEKGRTKIFYALTFLFFVLGIMSKSMLVTFPCVLLLLDFWPLDRWRITNVRRLILEKIPFFSVVLLVSWIAHVSQKMGGMLTEMSFLPLEARIENALISYARYLGKFFWPTNLCIYYPHPRFWPGTYVVLAALLVAGVSAFAWLGRRRFSFFFVGWFWFVGTAVPIIGLEQLCSQSIADRYTYVPTMGVALIAVWGLHALTKQWRHQTKAALLGSGVLFCLSVVLTRHEIGFWQDGDTVWKRAEAVTENNYIAHCNRGIILQSTQPEQAFAEFQEAAQINPNYPEAQRCLADIYHQRGQLDQAILHYQAATRADPGDSRPQFGWGIAEYQKGNPDAAIVHLQKALTINPENLQYQNTLGLLLAQKNRFSEAIPLLKNVFASAANNPDAANNLGVALLKNGQFDEAIAIFKQAQSFAPDSAALQANLTLAINTKQQQAAATNTPAAAATNAPPAH